MKLCCPLLPFQKNCREEAEGLKGKDFRCRASSIGKQGCSSVAEHRFGMPQGLPTHVETTEYRLSVPSITFHLGKSSSRGGVTTIPTVDSVGLSRVSTAGSAAGAAPGCRKAGRRDWSAVDLLQHWRKEKHTLELEGASQIGKPVFGGRRQSGPIPTLHITAGFSTICELGIPSSQLSWGSSV